MPDSYLVAGVEDEGVTGGAGLVLGRGSFQFGEAPEAGLRGGAGVEGCGLGVPPAVRIVEVD
jgi:hypothetical protein